MTTKAFLRCARGVDRRIDEALERVARIRARLEAGRMSIITGAPRGGASDWTDTVDRVIELEKRVNERIMEMARWKQAAMDAIDRVEDARLREVLELYYIDGLTWGQVAERMEITERWALSLHGRALLQVVVPKEISDSSL